MKYLALGFGLLTLLVLSLPAATQQKTSDDAAVRATVTDYIEGYYTGNAARMEKSLHAHYLKHVIHGNDPMGEKNCFTDNAGCTLPCCLRRFPSRADGTDTCAGRFGGHRFRQTRYSTLG